MSNTPSQYKGRNQAFHFPSFSFKQRGKRMLLRLNLMGAVFLAALFLLLFGSSNGTIPQHNELIYYSVQGITFDAYYCKEVNPALSTCSSNKIEHFHHLSTQGIPGLWHGNVKHEVAVFDPPADVEYKIDVGTFNFPAFLYFTARLPHPQILIRILQGPGLKEFRVIFEDTMNKCSGFNYSETQLHNFNLFTSKKWFKHAYYLIKNGDKMCVYTLKHEDLFRPLKPNGKPQTITYEKFTLIETILTKYYAPNFYCVDQIYGTFVTLYWDKQPGHPPEAHYYIINENDLQSFYLFDRNTLTDFDETVLKAIFDNEFDNLWYPAFTSYGRQIFVWFKFRNGNRAFNGLWKNEREYKVFFETVETDKPDRKLWHAKKDWIQYDKPVGRPDPDAQPYPSPIPFPEPRPQTTQKPTTLPPPPTTPKATTTTERTTTTTTLPSTTTPIAVTTTKKTTVLPSTTAAAPSTHPPSTTTSKATSGGTMPPTTSMPSTATTTVENTTSDSLNTTNNDTSSGQVTPSTAPATDNNGNAQPLEDNGPECDDKLFLYLLIVLIVIIVFEVIVLVILIILKSRGAKKMKEAMPRKKLSKSKSSIKKKPSPQAKKKKVKMPWAKESKKSISEKTAASKTEDAATGKTVDEKTATTHQTVDKTNYYTVGETFEKSSKKNKK